MRVVNSPLKAENQVRTFLSHMEVEMPQAPTLPGHKVESHRLDLLEEELEELRSALADRNLVEVADAIADLLYVLYGTAAVFGICAQDVFEEVHTSNMTKTLVGGAIHKGPDFSAPEPRIAKALFEQGATIEDLCFACQKASVPAETFEVECTCCGCTAAVGRCEDGQPLLCGCAGGISINVYGEPYALVDGECPPHAICREEEGCQARPSDRGPMCSLPFGHVGLHDTGTGLRWGVPPKPSIPRDLNRLPNSSLPCDNDNGRPSSSVSETRRMARLRISGELSHRTAPTYFEIEQGYKMHSFFEIEQGTFRLSVKGRGPAKVWHVMRTTYPFVQADGDTVFEVMERAVEAWKDHGTPDGTPYVNPDLDRDDDGLGICEGCEHPAVHMEEGGACWCLKCLGAAEAAAGPDLFAAEQAALVAMQTEKLTICKEALERLACLGNEPLRGNSDGNEIAAAALDNAASAGLPGTPLSVQQHAALSAASAASKKTSETD